MIISERKPLQELMLMLGDAKKIALVGCGNCASACNVGGEKEMDQLKAYLEENGRKVVATICPEECCHKLLVKKELKTVKAAQPDAIIGMSCGDGVGTVAEQVDVPVYPANNTLFLGQVERVGMFNEACRMCGDCVLGDTGGICPMTRCAKSLTSGPCGGQKNGKCEVNPENDCAWILIYKKLESLGQLDKLDMLIQPKGHAGFSHPRKVNTREVRK